MEVKWECRGDTNRSAVLCYDSVMRSAAGERIRERLGYANSVNEYLENNGGMIPNCHHDNSSESLCFGCDSPRGMGRD